MHSALLSVFWTASVTSIFFFNVSPAAAADCPPGTRPAKDADIAAMTTAGIPNAVVGMCWNADDPILGQIASDAKQWLMKYTKLDRSRITCLNPQFAEKLKSFMEQVPGGPPLITSAYRTTSEQQQAINSGASRVSNVCSGYHVYGLAADFNANTSQQTQWMRTNATRFGLRPIGDWDPNHFQDAAGRVGQCGTCAASGSDGIGGTGSGIGQQTQSPLQRAMSTFQNIFTPPQPIQCPTGLMLINSQCVPQQTYTSSPFDYIVPAATTGPAQSPVTSTSNTNNTSAQSILDQINAIAYPTSTPRTSSVATGSPVALNDDLRNAVALHDSSPTSTDSTQTTPDRAAALQTFTSPDLSQSSHHEASNYSSTFAILEQLKQALLAILKWLQPFGGTIPRIQINSAANATDTNIH